MHVTNAGYPYRLAKPPSQRSTVCFPRASRSHQLLSLQAAVNTLGTAGGSGAVLQGTGDQVCWRAGYRTGYVLQRLPHL